MLLNEFYSYAILHPQNKKFYSFIVVSFGLSLLISGIKKSLYLNILFEMFESNTKKLLLEIITVLYLLKKKE